MYLATGVPPFWHDTSTTENTPAKKGPQFRRISD